MISSHHRSNMELVAQGAGNIDDAIAYARQLLDEEGKTAHVQSKSAEAHD